MTINIRTKANKTDGRFYASAVQVPNWMWGGIKTEAELLGVSEHAIIKDALKVRLKKYAPVGNS